jgi:hypothetical protein
MLIKLWLFTFITSTFFKSWITVGIFHMILFFIYWPEHVIFFFFLTLLTFSTEVIVLAKQDLYHLSHTSNIKFCSNDCWYDSLHRVVSECFISLSFQLSIPLGFIIGYFLLIFCCLLIICVHDRECLVVFCSYNIFVRFWFRVKVA